MLREGKNRKSTLFRSIRGYFQVKVTWHLCQAGVTCRLSIYFCFFSFLFFIFFKSFRVAMVPACRHKIFDECGWDFLSFGFESGFDSLVLLNILQIPMFAIMSLGCYGLGALGYGMMVFRVCPEEEILLQKVQSRFSLVKYCAYSGPFLASSVGVLFFLSFPWEDVLRGSNSTVVH